MKNIYITIISAVITGMACCGAGAQVAEEQTYTIPLSNPDEPGTLFVGLHRGSVKVEGHQGKEVIVTVKVLQDKDRNEAKSRDGLKRIPNTAAQFNITERNNRVNISGESQNRSDFIVKVPRKFSLLLKTHHHGYIEVKGVTGEIEVRAHHDDIVLMDINGSVIANTHHGKITVTFQSITPAQPMAFSTYHGDIDVTFPANVNASTKIKTSKGEIFTAFDMEMKVQATKVESGTLDGTKIQSSGWLIGDIGSGGPEYMFSTYHGDVILRKR